MTPAQATTFDRISPANAATLLAASAARGCACEPYRDYLTFRRWRAVGRHVRKGEHGVTLPLVMEPETDTETGETRTRPRFGRSHVFCRCQTDQD
jgi:antirestriction protein ArdC